MSPIKIGFVFLLTIAFTEVASWTIDLPEVRKYHFEKAEKYNRNKENLKDFNKDTRYFDNIVPDSPHNRDELEHYEHESDDEENNVYGDKAKYAEDYEYMSYMEKKVHDIVQNGSVYLEGLRRSLEEFGELLKNCERLNYSQPQSPNGPNGPWLPENELPLPIPSIQPLPPLGPSPADIANQPPPDSANQQPPFLPGFPSTAGQSGSQNQPGSTNQSGSSNQPAMSNQSGSSNQSGMSNQSGSSTQPAMSNQSGSSTQPAMSNQSGSSNQQGMNNQPGSNNQQGSNQPNSTSNQPGTPGSNGTFFNQPFLTSEGMNREVCDRATRASEHVRRLAELAMWATRELQDRAYAQKYDKKNHDEEEEEMELLLRLAFFLDRLAHYTGYEPNAKVYMTPEPTRAPTTSRAPISAMGDVPDDVKMMMMECLDSSSSVPAPERCRFPLQHPEWMKSAMNITDAPGNIEPVSTVSYREVLRNPLMPPGYSRSKRDILTVLRQRSSASRQNSLTAVETRQKRSDDPLLHIMKYYVKHKVWTNSNPGAATESSAEFDVGNLMPTVKSDLTAVKNEVYKSVQKRSIEHKKYDHLSLPENPAQDISHYVKHRSGLNYIKDGSEIRQYLDKIRHNDRRTAKKLVQKLEKSLKSVHKRSIEPEKKVLPSRSQDPSQDISYYVKNKPGTRYRDNLVQVAQARAGLEQIFQTGNIEVVRRFGSNYNPLIPFPLGFGISRSFFFDL